MKVREDLVIQIPEELFSIREYATVVEKIEDLTHDIKALYLRLPEGEEVKFKAGQYVQIKAPQYGKSTEEVYRAYSIASSPSQHDCIQLIIRKVPEGICTTYVFDYLKEGDTLHKRSIWRLLPAGIRAGDYMHSRRLRSGTYKVHSSSDRGRRYSAQNQLFFGCVGKRIYTMWMK